MSWLKNIYDNGLMLIPIVFFCLLLLPCATMLYCCSTTTQEGEKDNIREQIVEICMPSGVIYYYGWVGKSVFWAKGGPFLAPAIKPDGKPVLCSYKQDYECDCFREKDYIRVAPKRGTQ